MTWPLPKTTTLAVYDRARQAPLENVRGRCRQAGCMGLAVYGIGGHWWCAEHRHLAEGGASPQAPSTGSGPAPGADLFTPRGEK